MNEHEFDALVASLEPLEPPVGVQRAVLEAVGVAPTRIEALLVAAEPAVGAGSRRSSRDERGNPGSPLPAAEDGRQAKRPSAEIVAFPRARRIWAAVGTVAALAAGALLLVGWEPERVGDPSALVARGVGEVTPTVALRVAVERGGRTERLSTGTTYSAGDTLIFRVSSSVAGPIELRRDDVVLYRGTVSAGDTDLRVGYTLEAGEAAARFVLEAGGARDVVEIPAVNP